jgi:TonB family protein
MTWVRTSAILVSFGAHTAALAALAIAATTSQPSALQSDVGRDDLSVLATVTMQTDDTIGFDAVNAARQLAAAASQPETKRQEDKQENAIEMDRPPPVEDAPPQAPIQVKTDDKQQEKQEANPASASVPITAQDEQHAMSRSLEARRNELFSLYNEKIYRAIAAHTLRPKEVHKGSVGVELTLSPAGKLVAHRIVKSSGVYLLDETAMANLESVPYPPPPAGLVNQPYTVTFSFDYSVK